MGLLDVVKSIRPSENWTFSVWPFQPNAQIWLGLIDLGSTAALRSQSQVQLDEFICFVCHIGTSFCSLGIAIGGAEVEVALQHAAVIRRHRLRSVVGPCNAGHRQQLVLRFAGLIPGRLGLGRRFNGFVLLGLLVVVLLGGVVVV